MKKILQFTIVLLIFAGCYEPADTSNQLDELFSSLFKTGEPGGAVLIARKGALIYKKGFGVADLQTKEAINPSTLFNTGSISKTFVAYGILKLASENKLSLDDPIQKYFPDFRDSSIAAKVKIIHLLTHSSGLPDIRKVKEDSLFYLTAKDEENWAPIKEVTGLEFEPGERFSYSNPAFNGLALIMEKVSGMKWQEFVLSRIMRPSGMSRSTFTDGAHPASGVSHGYVYDNGHFTERDYGEEPTFAAAGNGGVWSSVEELWNYEQAIQRYRFLDSDLISRSRTVYRFPIWKDSIPAFIGLSWFITRFDDTGMIGHTGSQGGFRADYVWLPQEEIFYVILCNTPKPLTETRRKVLSILKKE